jgi:hypothetical protein
MSSRGADGKPRTDFGSSLQGRRELSRGYRCRWPIYEPAAFVFGVGEGRHTQELTERCAGGTREPLVLSERKKHDVTRIVVNQLRTVHERAANDVTE